MKKNNYIKLSFTAPTNFCGKKIKIENLISKKIFHIPFTWNMSDYPYIDNIKKLLQDNNISIGCYTELKNNEFIFMVDREIDLKKIELK